jgi:hypothetical protein
MTRSYSLVGLFTLVTFACVAVAALKASTPLWASVVFSGTLLVLACAILGCWLGTKRRLWAGFTFFGWGYLALAFGPWFETNVQPRLLTSQLVSWTHERWHGMAPIADSRSDEDAARARRMMEFFNSGPFGGPFSGGSPAPIPPVVSPSQPVAQVEFVEDLVIRSGPSPTYPIPAPSIDPEQFYRIGHSLFAILFAALGAFAAGCFLDKRTPPSS